MSKVDKIMDKVKNQIKVEHDQRIKTLKNCYSRVSFEYYINNPTDWDNLLRVISKFNQIDIKSFQNKVKNRIQKLEKDYDYYKKFGNHSKSLEIKIVLKELNELINTHYH